MTFSGTYIIPFLSKLILTYPDKEVDHEEDVEGEVDLLGGVLCPGDAGLNRVAGGIDEIDNQGGNGKEEYQNHLRAEKWFLLVRPQNDTY